MFIKNLDPTLLFTLLLRALVIYNECFFFKVKCPRCSLTETTLSLTPEVDKWWKTNFNLINFFLITSSLHPWFIITNSLSLPLQGVSLLWYKLQLKFLFCSTAGFGAIIKNDVDSFDNEGIFCVRVCELWEPFFLLLFLSKLVLREMLRECPLYIFYILFPGYNIFL